MRRIVFQSFNLRDLTSKTICLEDADGFVKGVLRRRLSFGDEASSTSASGGVWCCFRAVLIHILSVCSSLLLSLQGWWLSLDSSFRSFR
ncbi:hypothetical protein EUTSA_v10017484mg [Eutrema salsugineum]|uniref:Uncharacterized protein n=1 Tax=Eutrema salsugineum TaxID=72664 RepID=V4LPZ6_EUTSA|nr:hypothetical protein EUTSA_v10017484mg [Eutrema salsugineum]